MPPHDLNPIHTTNIMSKLATVNQASLVALAASLEATPSAGFTVMSSGNGPHTLWVTGLEPSETFPQFIDRLRVLDDEGIPGDEPITLPKAEKALMRSLFNEITASVPEGLTTGSFRVSFGKKGLSSGWNGKRGGWVEGDAEEGV